MRDRGENACTTYVRVLFDHGMCPGLRRKNQFGHGTWVFRVPNYSEAKQKKQTLLKNPDPLCRTLWSPRLTRPFGRGLVAVVIIVPNLRPSASCAYHDIPLRQRRLPAAPRRNVLHSTALRAPSQRTLLCWLPLLVPRGRGWVAAVSLVKHAFSKDSQRSKAAGWVCKAPSRPEAVQGANLRESET